MFYRKSCSAISIFILAFFMASCSVTTAPTDASSGTTGQTTDATSDLTSSTTLDDDDEEEETKEEEKEVEEFVTANFSQLRTNMSVGQGEYLSTLAVLMSVDEADKEKFYALSKNNFSSIFTSSQTTAKEVIFNLRQEIVEANI